MPDTQIIPIRDVMPIGRVRRHPHGEKPITMVDLLLLAARAGDIDRERNCGVAAALVAAIHEELDTN